jgi:DNA-binding response OmpR family regulator
MNIAGTTNGLQRTLRVLVVDDDPMVVEMLAMGLSYEGIEVRTALTGSEALDKFRAFGPDVVLLDLTLPDMDGLEISRRLRACSDVAILILTGRADIEDRVEGLNSGADDYMVKPFAFVELTARMWAILRRRGTSVHWTLRAGDLVLDRQTRRVVHAGRQIELTKLEFRLLEFFITHPGHLFTREEIMKRVWGYEHVGNTNLVNVHVRNLRGKLGDKQNRLIRSVRAVGYMWDSLEETRENPI